MHEKDIKFVPRFVHFYMVPFTGLGLHNGFRGNQWLKNRIQIFKDYVIPSLVSQGSEYFYVWFCWRPEEKGNSLVQEFQKTLEGIRYLYTVHTFGGIPFYDDKYDDQTARERLLKTLEISLPELKSHVGEIPYVLLTIQPSDDMYLSNARKDLKDKFTELLEKNPENTRRAVGWKEGYIINFPTKEIAEYNTTGWTTDHISTYHTDTIPPFFTILFPSDVFLDPQKHFDHIGPYQSHEHIADIMDYTVLEGRGFVVGVHGENISTTYNHRYRGRILDKEETEAILIKTGTLFAPPVKFKPSGRMRLRKIVNLLPFRNQLKSLYYSLPIAFRKI